MRTLSPVETNAVSGAFCLTKDQINGIEVQLSAIFAESLALLGLSSILNTKQSPVVQAITMGVLSLAKLGGSLIGMAMNNEYNKEGVCVVA